MGGANRLTRPRLWRLLITVTTALQLLPVATSAASASVSQGAEKESRLIRTGLPVTLPFDDNLFAGTVAKSVWFERDERRFYFLDRQRQPIWGHEKLTQADLDTGAEIDSRILKPAAYAGPVGATKTIARGVDQGIVVDEANKKLYLAYANPDDGGFNPVKLLPGVPAVPNDPGKTAGGEICGGVVNTCFGGLLVINTTTLNIEQRIPMYPVRVDGVMIAPALRAMDLSPAVGDQPAKLHLIVEEFTHEAVTPVGAGDRQPRTLYNATNVFVVQIDPVTGSQDWTVRVEACRGTREPRQADLSAMPHDTAHVRPYPAAVFRSRDASDPSIYASCHSGTTQVGTVVQIPLDADWAPFGLPVGISSSSLQGVSDSESNPALLTREAKLNPGQRAFFGPDKAYEMVADPLSGRVLMRVYDNGADVWWVFDTKTFQLLATIGVGRANASSTMAGVDREHGRLYVLAAPVPGFSGGLVIADFRGMHVGQGILYPEFAALARGNAYQPLNVLPGVGDEPTVVYVPTWQSSTSAFFDALTPIVDATPRKPAVDSLAESSRSHDIDEAQGKTQTSYDGAARGYGARVLLVGGAEAAMRFGPADPIGLIHNAQMNDATLAQTQGSGTPEIASATKAIGSKVQYPVRTPCAEGNREMVFGSVGREGPAVVDASGSRGKAEAVVLDSSSRADAEAPISRCSRSDWGQIWSTALFGRSVVEEPQAGSSLVSQRAECVAGKEPTGGGGDPTTSMFAARVTCEDAEASGYSYARIGKVGALRLAEALSSYRLYLDPGRGIVARVESVARGIAIDGVLRIDTVRGQAEAWANGRRQPMSRDQWGDGYRANCDFDRTAGTCFRPQIFGVWTPGYSCGPCGDEATLADRISRGMGASGAIALRQPNRELAEGSEDGFTAAITKRETERFADLVLNNDLLQTVLPTLEIIRFAPPSQPLPPSGGPRGRQIYQFAGVEVSSSYSIQCVLVYDEETNTCAAEKQEPGSITINLSDGDGGPLAGGVFEVRKDVDADGVLGLVDSLVGEGACVTAEDGIGTCTFEDLQPGSYLVSQVAAPDGFSKVEDPWVSEVASGEARTVAFTNASNVSTIDVSATDEHGQPVAGAEFAVFPDPDSDGAIAADASPAATCTTGADGTCSMKVPVGSYVLVQTSAPGGLEGIEPVAFAFASGGQTAAVGVTNYAVEGGIPQPEPQPGPVYSDPVPFSPPVETVDDYTPPADSSDTTPLPQVMGDTIVRVIKAPGDALRLLSRDPQQAAAFTAALILFTLAAMAIRRRQAAVQLIQQ